MHIYEHLQSCRIVCVCEPCVRIRYVCVCVWLSIHLSSGRLGEETRWSPELRGQVQVFPAPSKPPTLLRSGEMDRIRERREGMGRRGHEPGVIDWRWGRGTVGTDIMDEKQFTFSSSSQCVWLLHGLVEWLCFCKSWFTMSPLKLKSVNLKCIFTFPLANHLGFYVFSKLIDVSWDPMPPCDLIVWPYCPPCHSICLSPSLSFCLSLWVKCGVMEPGRLFLSPSRLQSTLRFSDTTELCVILYVDLLRGAAVSTASYIHSTFGLSINSCQIITSPLVSNACSHTLRNTWYAAIYT